MKTPEKQSFSNVSWEYKKWNICLKLVRAKNKYMKKVFIADFDHMANCQ